MSLFSVHLYNWLADLLCIRVNRIEECEDDGDEC